ncbi:MAG: hypothetical protein IJJ65_00750 [Butyrivibrio sp.]|nr:hypothetical protein [Butyrivibrio sp.]
MKNIIICLMGEEDEILAKQISMLKERHNATVKRVTFDEAESIISAGEEDTLFISDDEGLANKAREKGMSVNSPQKMKESYEKAIEMLKTLGNIK